MAEFHIVPRRSEPAMRADALEGTDNPLPMFDEGFGFCMGRRKYYVNVRVGAELRSSDRLAEEGQVRVSGIAFLYLVICSGAIMLFGTLCLLYLLKSGMGINLSAEDSVLHPLLEMVHG